MKSVEIISKDFRMVEDLVDKFNRFTTNLSKEWVLRDDGWCYILKMSFTLSCYFLFLDYVDEHEIVYNVLADDVN